MAARAFDQPFSLGLQLEDWQTSTLSNTVEISSFVFVIVRIHVRRLLPNSFHQRSHSFGGPI
jgi:hypothetical protein